MKFKAFCLEAARRLRTHNPAVCARFDVGGDYFRNREEADPAFSLACKGSIRVDRRRILTACACLIALCALLHRMKK